MASITTINGSDVISTSRTVINTNFSNLNTDKIETSTLDTDTTLAANSDSKIATQKATKAYVDASVNPTGRSWNEYAADAGATDAYAISLTGVTVYTIGQTFKFKANTANTGACTININGLGAKTIKKNVSSDLATGDILANQLVTVTYDGTNMQILSGTNNTMGFGNGSDGDVTISSPTTLTRDMFYNNLTVTSTLNTANWRVFVKGTLSGTGTISANGGNGGNGGNGSSGNGGTAGAAGTKVPDGYFTSATVGPGAAGLLNSVTGALGTAPSNVNPSIGVVGASGGNGGGFRVADPDAGSGNAPGTVTAPLQTFGIDSWGTIKALDIGISGALAKLQGSSGSGGGRSGVSGNLSAAGGGSGGAGANGGIVFIVANILGGTITYTATGGTGGNGGNGFASSAGAGGGGGGGGGSGGVVVVIYNSKTGTTTYTLTAGSGGTGGAGATGGGDVGQNGSAGAAGTTGISYELSYGALS